MAFAEFRPATVARTMRRFAILSLTGVTLAFASCVSSQTIPTDVRDTYEIGVRAMEVGDHDTAVSHFALVLKRRPELVAPRRHRAECYVELANTVTDENPDLAASRLELAIGDTFVAAENALTSAERADLWLRHADLLERAGRTSDARAIFERETFGPRVATAHRALGRLIVAEVHAETLGGVPIDPTTVIPVEREDLRQKLREAKHHYEESLQRAPNHPVATRGLGTIAIHEGRPLVAIEYFDSEAVAASRAEIARALEALREHDDNPPTGAAEEDESYLERRHAESRKLLVRELDSRYAASRDTYFGRCVARWQHLGENLDSLSDLTTALELDAKLRSEFTPIYTYAVDKLENASAIDAAVRRALVEYVSGYLGNDARVWEVAISHFESLDQRGPLESFGLARARAELGDYDAAFSAFSEWADADLDPKIQTIDVIFRFPEDRGLAEKAKFELARARAAELVAPDIGDPFRARTRTELGRVFELLRESSRPSLQSYRIEIASALAAEYFALCERAWNAGGTPDSEVEASAIRYTRELRDEDVETPKTLYREARLFGEVDLALRAVALDTTRSYDPAHRWLAKRYEAQRTNGLADDSVEQMKLGAALLAYQGEDDLVLATQATIEKRRREAAEKAQRERAEAEALANRFRRCPVCSRKSTVEIRVCPCGQPLPIMPEPAATKERDAAGETGNDSAKPDESSEEPGTKEATDVDSAANSEASGGDALGAESGR